jgi:hypothetical protein
MGKKSKSRDQGDDGSAVFTAISRRKLDPLLKLMASHPNFADLRNREGKSPLQAAIESDADDIAFAMLNSGIPVRREEANLVWAALVRRPEIVRRFIELGADVNVRTMLGTPLNVAAAPPARMRPGSDEDRFEIIRLLLAAGADVNAGNTLGSPLENAVGKNQTRAAMILLDAGASLENAEELIELAETNENAELAAALRAAKKKPRSRRSAVKSATSNDPILAELESICGSKAQPLDGIPNAFSFHVDSSKSIDLPKLQSRLLKQGRFLFALDHQRTRVALLQTTDKYDAMKAMATNGDNYELSNEQIIAWLRELEATQPFILTGIGFDFLSGEFTTKVKETAKLAKRMYKFCPDIVDQGLESVEALERTLRDGREFYFWWD